MTLTTATSGSVLPKYHQHELSFEGEEYQVYSNVKNTYKAVPRPHFGLSDHISEFLYPAYRQLLKQAPPVSKTIKVWNEGSELVLQDCFNSRGMVGVFKTPALRGDCTVDLKEYAAAVTGYICKYTKKIIPTKRCKTYTNDKPWKT